MCTSKICCLSLNICGTLLLEGLCDTVKKVTDQQTASATKLTNEAIRRITQYLMQNEHISCVVV